MATKAIPVVAAKVASTQTDFPVFIQPSAMTGWGSLTLAEAQSIRFYSDSGLTTELAREVVSADEIHVKVPSLTTTTTIYADYDGIRADYAVGATYGRNAVWSGYSTVYHLDDTTDSKAGTNTLTAFNTPTYTTGKLGNGVSLVRASSQYLRKTSATGMNCSQVAFSTTFWAKRTSNNYQFVYFIAGNSYSGQWTTGGNNYIASIGDNETWGSTSDRNLPATGTWYKMNFVRESSGSSKVYKDGALVTSFTNTWTTSTTTDISIGCFPTSDFWDGMIDEFRFTSTAQTANWITTEYNNQSDVGAFWGTVTDAGGGGGATFIPKVSMVV